MSIRPKSLYWLFWDMGFTREQCHHLVKCLDRLRLCNLSQSDWDAKIRFWGEIQVNRATSTLREQIRNLLGLPIDKHSGYTVEQLFDEDFQTEEVTTPPVRPRA